MSLPQGELVGTLSLSTQTRRLLLFAPRRKALALRADRYRISGQDRAFLQALAGRGESGEQCVTEVVTEGVVGAIFRPLDAFHTEPHPVAVERKSLRPCPIGEMGDPLGPREENSSPHMMPPRKGVGSHGRSALKVSQRLISPCSRPRLNQRTRWSELPCVKASGTT